jgi:alkaline phosphatase/alkaline phosphatase D
MITQPYIQEEPTGGFIEIRVEPPNEGQPAFIKFLTIDKNGVVLNEVTRRAKS